MVDTTVRSYNCLAIHETINKQAYVHLVLYELYAQQIHPRTGLDHELPLQIQNSYVHQPKHQLCCYFAMSVTIAHCQCKHEFSFVSIRMDPSHCN
jgi:hypothetical protein